MSPNRILVFMLFLTSCTEFHHGCIYPHPIWRNVKAEDSKQEFEIMRVNFGSSDNE